MAIVMQLWGMPNGQTARDGQYLQSFDFEAHGGQGEAVMTPDITQAMRFLDLADALMFYRQTPRCRPRREDGCPNRPLTATNWGFVSADGDTLAGVSASLRDVAKDGSEL